MADSAPTSPESPAVRDKVDNIVASWQREAPHLDLQPLHILSRISRLSRHLDLARRTAFAKQGLEVGEFDVLAALRRAGAPYELSPGVLVEQTLSTSGTMTNRVDQLERRGFVVRHPDPNDRRGVKVQMTEAGRNAVDDALAELLEREKQILLNLEPSERDDLRRLLRRLLVSFEVSDHGPL